MPDQGKPSLENLKKRAKQVHRWHRDRVYTVAEQIRSKLPRFADLSDEAIFAASFRLADAQELIARQNGFECWSALKTGLETMPTTTQPTTAQPTFLVTATAYLFVKDIHATCTFFEDVLGFRTVFRYGDPPYFGVVSRDSASLNLRCVDAPTIDRELAAREDLFAVSIGVMAVRDLKQLFAEFTEAGADFHRSLKKQPWGGHDFTVKDPDGNLINFLSGD